MTEPSEKLCECGCGNEGRIALSLMHPDDLRGAMVAGAHNFPLITLYDRIRSNRLRAKPAGELEALTESEGDALDAYVAAKYGIWQHPLRGLADAMRSLCEPLTCRQCTAEAPAYRMAWYEQCWYCRRNGAIQDGIAFNGVIRRELPYTAGIAANEPAPMPEVEAERAVWDWPVDSDAPDGCA